MDKDFDKLYNYVKNLLGYDKNQSLPKSFVLRLKGLSTGKFIENKKIKDKANYSYDVILATFMYKKKAILKAFQTKNFKNENNKFNYMLAIVQNSINDVYIRINENKKSSIAIEHIELNSDFNQELYKRKTEEKDNKKLKELW